MEERISRVTDHIKVMPDDLLGYIDKLVTINMNFYFFLNDLIFFDNQYCKENIIDLAAIGLKNFSLECAELPYRTNNTIEIVKLESFQELINFPSAELIMVRNCGFRCISQFKEFIIQELEKMCQENGIPKRTRKSARIIDLEFYKEYLIRRKEAIRYWFGE